MTYEMNKKLFEEVTKLSGQERYDHFLDIVGDFEELWSLRNEEGFVTMADDDGNECIPFWPHPDYASALVTGSWSDCSPERIILNDLLNKWLPGMIKDGLRVSCLTMRFLVIEMDCIMKNLTTLFRQRRFLNWCSLIAVF